MKKTPSNNKEFFFYFFYTEKYAFCQKTCFKKLNLYYYIYVTVFCVAGSRKCSNKTPIPIQICIGLVDAVLQYKILGNRSGISTQILIAMDYYFFFYILEIYLRKKQKHLLMKMFGSPHTSNWIHLLRNCFSNCAYPKDLYITLHTQKILLVSV